MRRNGTQTIFGALAALVLLMASCGYFGGDDNEEAAVTTATRGDADSSATETNEDTTTTTAVSETTVPTIPDLTDVAWVVNDFDGLVDDQGRSVASTVDQPTDSRPSVVRAGDGSIYYVLDGRLWRRAVDAAQPEEINTEASDVFGVDHDGDGNIIVNPYGNAEVVAENGAGPRSDNILGESGDFITAANRITVRILPTDAVVDELGYITQFRSPARLEVERDGVVEWTIPAGGIAAPWLSLIDFDGRFVMMARYPTEPADPIMQHIVYDLDCPDGNPAGHGCTRTFWARWGTAALVGPDREPGDDDLNTVLLDICPTMGIEIASPAEMTDPASFDEDFGAEDLDAFRRAALQLTTCDPLGLGDPQQPGLRYMSGADDPNTDGWMWTELARALRGPFTPQADNTWIWSRHPDAPRGVLTQDFGQSHLTLQPGRRVAGPVAVTATPEAILVAGRTDSATADAIVAALQRVADERDVRLSTGLDTSGTGHAADLLDEFVTAIDDGLVADLIGEIHLTADDVIQRLQEPTEPSTTETDLGFLMADFASGGEGVYPELPLADDILLALGSEVVARRQSAELFRRLAWTVNSTDFAARVGPFNVLDLVPSPSEIVVGPHPRCAGPEATSSPPELASFRRIGILPLEGSIDSCLEWSAVDLYVDDNGEIQGLSLDLTAP